MRRFFIAAIFLFILSCKNKNRDTAAAANAAKDSLNFTTVQWIDSIKNIGTLNMGVTVQISFRFKNTGNKPLYIVTAQPSCGCTVADYPKEPIAQGKEGVIVAAFDTNKGHPGSFKKGISVTTNTQPSPYTLFFEGEIKSKDGEHAAPEPVEVPGTEDKKQFS